MNQIRIPITASYANCRHNFVIMGIPKGNCANDALHSLTCVIKNVLQRDYPVPATDYLKVCLGELPKDCVPFAIIDRSGRIPSWYNTIKGSLEGDNPASLFFYKIWPEMMPEYDWVRQLIIPEANISDILDDNSEKWDKQAVDFYLPQAKLVVEIDGSQHKSDLVQATLDRERDRAFEYAGITVIRIPAGDIRYKHAELNVSVTKIRSLIDANDDLQNMYAQVDNETVILQKKYESVIRFQFAVLNLIENGALSLDEKEWQFSVDGSDKELFTIALIDLFVWYEKLYALKGDAFKRPIVITNDSKNSVRITSDIYTRCDEREQTGIVIYTDYWDNKDYYRVSCAELVNYNIDMTLQPGKKESLEFLLKNIFGYDSFQPGQLQIITNILNLKRTIGILPTGGGKSLCYQFSSILQPAVSFSVCPLTSLEMDQKDELDKLRFTRTNFIAKIQKKEEKLEALEKFGQGKYQIVWITPERFQDENFRLRLEGLNRECNFAYAIIDEVHCLSEWGHDFRTSYLSLVQTIEYYCPQATLVGLTATASQAVLTDLKIEFNIDSINIKALPSLQRENLTMHVIKTNDKRADLNKLLSNAEMASEDTVGIIFTLYRDKTGDQDEETYSFSLLRHLRKVFPDLKSDKFHSDIPNKREVQYRFKHDDINLLSATKAFGMGINKDDIRYTIHYELPWSVEAFYQEAGRAGRGINKKPADCYILYTPENEAISKEAEQMFYQSTSAEEISKIQRELKNELNDIGKIFFLWSCNNKGVDPDVECIGRLINKINVSHKEKDKYGRKFCVIQPDVGDNPLTSDELELAVYRLKLLGVVNDLTIDWRGNSSYKVYLSGGYNEQVASDHFYTYIRKHEPGFGLPWDNDTLKYKNILDNTEKTYLKRYSEALITWTYDNIIYSRRRMIQNIKEYCKDYTDPITFRKRIDDFLRISDKSIQLDSIVENYSSWDMWFDVFHENINNKGTLTVRGLTVEGYAALREATARYLESYKNITGLNIIYVLSGALCGRYNLELDTYMMDSCIEDINEKYPDYSTEIIEKLISFIYEHKIQIGETVLQELIGCVTRYNRKLAERLYDLFEDDYSLAIIIANLTSEINKAMEEL